MHQVYGVITCCFILGLNSKFNFSFFSFLNKHNNALGIQIM